MQAQTLPFGPVGSPEPPISAEHVGKPSLLFQAARTRGIREVAVGMGITATVGSMHKAPPTLPDTIGSDLPSPPLQPLNSLLGSAILQWQGPCRRDGVQRPMERQL